MFKEDEFLDTFWWIFARLPHKPGRAGAACPNSVNLLLFSGKEWRVVQKLYYDLTLGSDR